MNKLFDIFLFFFLVSLATSYRFTGDEKVQEVRKTCKTTEVQCSRNPIRKVICGSDGKSYSNPAMLFCLNKCVPEEEKVTLDRHGFCEPEFQKEYLEKIKMGLESMKNLRRTKGV